MCFSTKRGFRCSFRQIRMSTAFASTCALVGGGLIYARVVADTVGPGATRLLLLAPALASTSPPSWCWTQKPSALGRRRRGELRVWTNFKLIALAAGRGQLTGPVLSAPTRAPRRCL